MAISCSRQRACRSTLRLCRKQDNKAGRIKGIPQGPFFLDNLHLPITVYASRTQMQRSASPCSPKKNESIIRTQARLKTKKIEFLSPIVATGSHNGGPRMIVTGSGTSCGSKNKRARGGLTNRSGARPPDKRMRIQPPEWGQSSPNDIPEPLTGKSLLFIC